MNEVAKLGSSNQLVLPATTQAAQQLFVINLCASMTPMPAVPKNLKGFEKYKLYQVSKQEDGRRRFRLRLGFFTSEADAEWVLNSVRNLYPAAFTGCVTAEDLRYTGDAVPAARAVAPAPVATPAPAKPVTPVAATQKAAVPAPPAAPAKVNTGTTSVATPAVAKAAAPAPIVTPAPAKPAAPLTASAPAATPQQVHKPHSYGQPFHVGRGVDLPETNLELTDEYAVLSTPATPYKTPTAQPINPPVASAARSAAPATVASRTPASKAAASLPPGDGPIRSASIISPPKVVDDYVPILDTTLTIRTLTKTEAEDPNRPKWFAVQLALSEQPINLDTMPKLDIFAAYTLYSVALMEGPTIRHALRLGFFSENVSAEAVMGYLKAFFNMPTINQISSAEFERFSEPKPRPAAESPAKVVELDAKRPGAPIKPLPPIADPQATAKPVSKPLTNSKPLATQSKTRITTPARPQSFLSRLIGRQLD